MGGLLVDIQLEDARDLPRRLRVGLVVEGVWFQGVGSMSSCEGPP